MFDLIKKIFKKDNMSSNTTSEEISVQLLTDKFSGQEFQWIKGDKMLNVEKFSSVVQNGDIFFIQFKSGQRINYELLEEYMTWYPEPIRKTEPVVEAPKPQTAAVTGIQFDDRGVSTSKSEMESSPIYSLLKRQKKNDVEVSLNIKIPLPSKDLFSVLVSSFDDAENEIIQFIIDSIDIEDIRNTLSKSIRENYYGKAKPQSSSSKSNKETKDE